MSTQRSYRCTHCNAVVSVPDRRRTISLDAVREHHDDSCPGQLPRVRR